MLNEFQDTQKSNHNPSQVESFKSNMDWSPPSSGSLKLKSNAVVIPGLDFVCIGVVVRDSAEGRAAVSSSSDDEASDTSRLWQIRLGHVGEKALQGLVKQGLLKGAKTEALMYASHIVNRLPTSALDGKTPKEVWSGQPVSDYDRLHIFGCPSYFHVTESKLDPRAKKAVFVGFSEGVKGFRLWNSESKKII
ncbi:hypothetical protein LWI28_019555 [Acer negundo]|uniref:GAG-pre-integrase domain-containing protein n=1 Tax=Acer negundo TaxID=4023 RepID=A0AAD5J0E0_ACENE|nr:hypothetical protein LWI28_019555 [Acer negundo]